MRTKKPVADLLRERLTDVAERGRVIGQALRVRADMAATRRRLRQTYAELGEVTYARLVDGTLPESTRFAALRQSIDGLRAEVSRREDDLREIMKGGFRPAAQVRSVAEVQAAAGGAVEGPASEGGPAPAGS